MYHSNLIGGIAAGLSVLAPVVWGIHSTEHDARAEKRTTLWTVAVSTLAVTLAAHPNRLLLRVGPTAARAAGLRDREADGYPQRV